MNNRVNLLYFIEHLLELSLAKSHPTYISMIQSDLPTIVDRVSPPDGSGIQNITSIRKVLQKIRDKNLISDEEHGSLLSTIADREREHQHLIQSSQSQSHPPPPPETATVVGIDPLDNDIMRSRSPPLEVLTAGTAY